MTRSVELDCTAQKPGLAGFDASVRFACPQCGTALKSDSCQACGFCLELCCGILDALPPVRKAYYASFIEDYEQIRASEGRGSKNEDFYLALPYRDTTGRNTRQWQIRSRSFDCLLQQILNPNFPARGARVLDLGAGNGWMSYRLAKAGYLPVAVDLLVNDADGLGAADYYRAHLPCLFPRVRAELGRLPFQQGQFDVAIFNASLHYAEDYVACLREAFYSVHHGGMVIVCDTPWYADDRSGRQMLAERRSVFMDRYGFASDSIKSLEYLTDERLGMLEQQLRIQWSIRTPHYDLRWRLRPLIACLRGRREPSRFRIHVARKLSA